MSDSWNLCFPYYFSVTAERQGIVGWLVYLL